MKRNIFVTFVVYFAISCLAAEAYGAGTSTTKQKAKRRGSTSRIQTADTTTTELTPIIDYRPRYVHTALGSSVVSFLDTAKGVVILGKRSSSGIDTWRAYDLLKIAKKKEMAPLAIEKIYENRSVNQRYTASSTGGSLIFLDTVSGRTWTCRHGKGILDTWKCYDTQALMMSEQ